jgi:hypothetical protein
VPDSIVRVDKAGRNEQWTIDLCDDNLTLSSPSGDTYQWTIDEIGGVIREPSFTQSIKYHQVMIGGVGSCEFKMEKPTADKLHAFLSRRLARGGPAVVEELRSTGKRAVLSGIVLAIIGGAILAWVTRQPPAQNSDLRGLFKVGFISFGGGLLALGKGVWSFVQMSRVNKMSGS